MRKLESSWNSPRVTARTSEISDLLNFGIRLAQHEDGSGPITTQMLRVVINPNQR